MRTPPPVLPSGKEDSPDYKRSWLDREGPDAVLHLRAVAGGGCVFILSLLIWGLVMSQHEIHGLAAAALTFVCAALTGYLAFHAGMKLTSAGGAVAGAVTFPSGKSTPYEHQFSYQESLAARGDVAGALESYEAIMAEQPAAVAPRLHAAEHYARNGRDPRRAAQVFKEIREIPEVSVRDAVYASSRLVDLYDGPLGDPGRALVELRRIIEKYPETAIARNARAALPEMKARLEALRKR